MTRVLAALAVTGALLAAGLATAWLRARNVHSGMELYRLRYRCEVEEVRRDDLEAAVHAHEPGAHEEPEREPEDAEGSS